MIRKFCKKVYYIESEKDNTVCVAMDIAIDQKNQIVRWYDTIKERVIEYEKIIDTNSQHFVFLRREHEVKNERIYTIIPMTLEIYNQKVRQNLLAPKDFNSLEDLMDAFEETKKQGW